MDKAKGFVLAFYVAIRPPTCRFYADPFKTPSCDSGNNRPARYHFIQDDDAEFGGKRGLIVHAGVALGRRWARNPLRRPPS
jgi:hypothetical protein